MDIEEAKDGLKILTEPSEGGLTRLFSQKGIDAIEHLQAENAKLKSELEEARGSQPMVALLRNGRVETIQHNHKDGIPEGEYVMYPRIAARQQKG